MATGIRDIAREAGTTSSTLYHYVSNKEDLLVAIMRDGFEKQIERARAAIEVHSTPQAQLAALVRQHVLLEIRQQPLAKVITAEFRFLGPEAREVVVPLRDAYERVWDQVIDHGVRKRVFKVRDPQMARLGILQMCAGPGKANWAEWTSNPDEISDALARMALNVLQADSH